MRGSSGRSTLAACVLAGFIGSPADQAKALPFIRGDTNADASHDMGDVITLSSFLLDNGALSCLDAGDINDDGAVGLDDLIVLVSSLSNGTPLSPPFLSCGLDPTPDALGCVSYVPCSRGLVVSFAANPPRGPVPLDVTFVVIPGPDATPSTTFAWDFGDGEVGSGRTVVHTYVRAGSFKARLTVKGPGGITETYCTLITPGDPVQPSASAGIQWSVSEGTITLSWKIPVPGDKISVYRGPRWLADLRGDAQGFVCQESYPGLFRYTAVLYAGGRQIRSERAIVNLGKLEWDAPAAPIRGYYVHVAKDPEPLECPVVSEFDAGQRREVRLKELYYAGLLDGSGRYSFSVSAYAGEVHSQCAEPVRCYYDVVLGEPGEPCPDEP